MKRQKWSVSRFKSNDRFSYPAGKYRFETKLAAKLAKKLFQVEAYLTGSPRPHMSYVPQFGIDTELRVEYRDLGPWRSYHFNTSGDTLEELIENATISEVDQDGGDLDSYGIENASRSVEEECLELIHNRIKGSK